MCSFYNIFLHFNNGFPTLYSCQGLWIAWVLDLMHTKNPTARPRSLRPFKNPLSAYKPYYIHTNVFKLKQEDLLCNGPLNPQDFNLHGTLLLIEDSNPYTSQNFSVYTPALPHTHVPYLINFIQLLFKWILTSSSSSLS